MANPKAPEVDSVGIVVTGEVKTIYNVVKLGRDVLVDGAIMIQAKTECDRIISVLKQGDENPIYEVHVSKPGSDISERHYRGPEGSDACRVFNGYEAHCKRQREQESN